MKSKVTSHFPFLMLILVLAGPVWAGVEVRGTGTASAADLFNAWKQAYGPLVADVQLKYEPCPGRDGIQNWLGGGADFVLTDLPLSGGEEKQTGGNLLYLPVGLTAAVVTYNLPAIPSGLRLTPSVLSHILSGQITRWNDPALKELNPGLPLTAMQITVVRQEDENSLYDLFPFFLKNIDDGWTLEDSPDQRLKWPVGIQVKGNEEVTQKLRETAGSIGVVDLGYANQNQLPAAELKNAAGQFAGPTVESITASIADITDLPEDLKVFVSHPRDSKAYPLSSFLWVLVRSQSRQGDHDFSKPKALADFLSWITTNGQKVESGAGGIPLPNRLMEKVQEKIKVIQTDDSSVEKAGAAIAAGSTAVPSSQ
jgi:phosphate transport system substrate-binding protein